jgi:acetoin utilization deacetylase AcuC-like enzyme
VRTFHWPGHGGHDPGRLPQPPGGSAAYYSEVADRGGILLATLLEAGLGPVLDVDDVDGAGAAEPPELRVVHDPDMVDFLRTAHRDVAAADGRVPGPDDVVVPEAFAVGGSRPRSTSPWAQLGWWCTDTSSPLFARTWEAALGAARCAAAAAQDVLDGAPSAYALCRPPGHHAARGRFGGFCFLNNAAVAAQRLAASGRRVAVVDVDLHHGNGTQDIFWERGDVLYASLHVDPDVDYPYRTGWADERGAGDGRDATVNLPLSPGCGEDDYLAALDAAMAAVAAFGAEALVVSLGVDTHADDPIGAFRLRTTSFPRVGERLAAPVLPTVLVQEGGYHLPSLGRNVLGVLAAFT